MGGCGNIYTVLSNLLQPECERGEGVEEEQEESAESCEEGFLEGAGGGCQAQPVNTWCMFFYVPISRFRIP